MVAGSSRTWDLEMHTPTMKYPLDCFVEPEVRRMACMFPSGAGKTELQLNIIGYTAVNDPMDIMLMRPLVQNIKDFRKRRLIPMLQRSRSLAEVMGSMTEKVIENDDQISIGPGVYLSMGVPSASFTADRHVPAVLADEIDKMPLSIPGEGDLLAQLEKRSDTFHNSKMVVTSTPASEKESKIYILYKKYKRFVYKPWCPGCDGRVEWVREGIQYSTDKTGSYVPGSAFYRCPVCSVDILEKDRMDLVRKGCWEVHPECLDMSMENVSFHHIGFLSGFVTFEKYAAKKCAALKGEVDDRIAFSGLYDGWPYSIQTEANDPDHFLERREHYNWPVPREVLYILQSIDVQDKCVKIWWYGHGYGDQKWLLYACVFRGDPSKKAFWAELNRRWIKKKMVHAVSEGNGGKVTMKPLGVVIDTGGSHTKQVMAFVRGRQREGIIGVKGGSRVDADLYKESKEAMGQAGKQTIWIVNVHKYKNRASEIMSAKDEHDDWVFRLPVAEFCGRDYCSEITAERRVRSRKTGKLIWKKKHDKIKNDAFDGFVYDEFLKDFLSPDCELLDLKLQAAARGVRKKRKAWGRT